VLSAFFSFRVYRLLRTSIFYLQVNCSFVLHIPAFQNGTVTDDPTSSLTSTMDFFI
jgi:hypothetical protein